MSYETELLELTPPRPPAAAPAPTPVPTNPPFTADSPRADRVVPAHNCRLPRNPNGSLRSRPPSDITQVVIHVIQGHYAHAIESWRTGASCFKPQYAISKTGEITQVVAERFAAQHANQANGRSIGIEHDGFATDPKHFTEAMYVASAALTKDICRRYGIPIDATRIIGHDQAPGTTHGDPGGYWDWEYYFALVTWDGQAATRPIRIVVDYNSMTFWPTSDAWTVMTRAPVRHSPHPNHSWGPKYYRAPASKTASEPAVFLPDIAVAGTYELSAWWPTLPGNNQEVTIRALTGSPLAEVLTVRVDQRSRTGRTRRTLALPATPQWFPLGSLNLRAGQNLWVEVSRQSNKTGPIVADAIRLLKRS